jgi:hypothetical protein
MSSVSLNSSHQDSPVPVALLPLIVFQKRDPLSNSASSWCLRLSMSEKIRLSPTPFAVTTASLRRTPLCGDRYKDRFEYRTVRRAHRGQMDQSVIRDGTHIGIDGSAFNSVNDVVQINHTSGVGNDRHGKQFCAPSPGGHSFYSASSESISERDN